MSKHTQECKSCGEESKGEIYHLGFSNMDCMYCDSCPRVLLLNDRNLLKSKGIVLPNHRAGDESWEYYDRHLLPIYEKIETLFKSCSCGGNFKASAAPRCSICNDYLSGIKPDLDKPSTWLSRYVFVTIGSFEDVDHLD